MPSRQAGEHDAQKQAALLYILKRRIYERVMFASMMQAAAFLKVSPRTIAFHKYRMMEHLRVQSTAALVHFAVREGLI